MPEPTESAGGPPSTPRSASAPASAPGSVAVLVAELHERARVRVLPGGAQPQEKDMGNVVDAEFGTLDIFFANAGVAFGTPIETTDEAAYSRLMDVNVKGVFFSVQAVLPLMREGGSIVLNTSWLNQVGTPGRALLSASKAAVRSFARTLSAELLDRKIRVNAVSPGSIETPIHRGKEQSEADFRAYTQRVGSQVPLQRMGRPEEIAAAVLFLASVGSSYMLGAEIVVDGGRAEL